MREARANESQLKRVYCIAVKILDRTLLIIWSLEREAIDFQYLDIVEKDDDELSLYLCERQKPEKRHKNHLDKVCYHMVSVE